MNYYAKPEQLDAPAMFIESLQELVEAGLVVHKFFSMHPENIEPPKVKSAKQIVCFFQYVINKIGVYNIDDLFGKAFAILYSQRHTAKSKMEPSVYYTELAELMIKDERFLKLPNQTEPELQKYYEEIQKVSK